MVCLEGVLPFRSCLPLFFDVLSNPSFWPSLVFGSCGSGFSRSLSLPVSGFTRRGADTPVLFLVPCATNGTLGAYADTANGKELGGGPLVCERASLFASTVKAPFM